MLSVPTSAVIHPATKADREAAINLLLVLHEHGIPIQLAELATAIDGVPDRPERGILFVATLQGRSVGVAYLSFTWALEHGGKTAWLEELYVAPEQREKGIGRARSGFPVVCPVIRLAPKTWCRRRSSRIFMLARFACPQRRKGTGG
jgi:GNAT superfamily N-acetyltransferase